MYIAGELVMRRISSTNLRGLLCALLLAAQLGCTVATPQVGRAPAPAPSPAPSPTDESERRTSEPYQGDLSIFEDPQRERNLQIDRVMDILKIKAGSNVADVGAGSGWFTVRAARRVGEGGLVYAVEINPDYLKHIEDRAVREKLPNIRTVLGKENDPQLPVGGVDAVLLLKTYHEVARPVALLKNIRRSMRGDALLGIIDRNGKGDDHGLDADAVIKEARRASFRLVEQYDFVKPDGMDYFLVFALTEHE